MTEFLFLGPEDGPTFLFAHGAGAPMDNAWMTDFSKRLAERGIRTARFEFAYMAARRHGERKPPPKAESVMGEYRAAIAALGSSARIAIGGKSMGGRVASLIADEQLAAGTVGALVCLGYPFHPSGNPGQLRTRHLEQLAVPALICQGTRDPLGSREEVAGYTLSPAIRLHWLEDGDHDLKPRKAVSGLSARDNLDSAADAVAAFLKETL